MRNHVIQIGVSEVLFLSCCSPDLLFVLSSQEFHHDVSWCGFFGFILFVVCLASWICRFVGFFFFCQIWGNFSHCPFEYFVILSLFPGLWRHECRIFHYSPTGSWGAVIFFLVCFFSVSRLVICCFLFHITSYFLCLLFSAVGCSVSLKNFAFYFFSSKISISFCYISFSLLRILFLHLFQVCL